MSNDENPDRGIPWLLSRILFMETIKKKPEAPSIFFWIDLFDWLKWFGYNVNKNTLCKLDWQMKSNFKINPW